MTDQCDFLCKDPTSQNLHRLGLLRINKALAVLLRPLRMYESVVLLLLFRGFTDIRELKQGVQVKKNTGDSNRECADMVEVKCYMNINEVLQEDEWLNSRLKKTLLFKICLSLSIKVGMLLQNYSLFALIPGYNSFIENPADLFSFKILGFKALGWLLVMHRGQQSIMVLIFFPLYWEFSVPLRYKVPYVQTQSKWCDQSMVWSSTQS